MRPDPLLPRTGGQTKVGVLFSGRGSNLRALVEAQGDGYVVAAVASDRPDAAGVAWAKERGVPTLALAPRDAGGKAAFEARIDAFLRGHDVALIALAGYMRLLSPAFVDRWPGGILNIHPSLLPRYRGLDTHARAIAAGDQHAGCSVHVVTAELDAGRVLGQAQAPILPGDTADALAARVLLEEHRLYPRVLRDYARTMTSPLDRVRAAAMALPGAEERVSHGQPSFFVAGERFAQLRDDHHGDRRRVVCVRTSGPDEQAMLLAAAPETYSRAAYLGSADWIDIDLADDPDWALIEERIAQSWELAAPAGLLEAGGR